jgi:hypothetical protein
MWLHAIGGFYAMFVLPILVDTPFFAAFGGAVTSLAAWASEMCRSSERSSRAASRKAEQSENALDTSGILS